MTNEKNEYRVENGKIVVVTVTETSKNVKTDDLVADLKGLANTLQQNLKQKISAAERVEENLTNMRSIMEVLESVDIEVILNCDEKEGIVNILFARDDDHPEELEAQG